MAVFYISGLTLIVGTSFYIVFGSGEIQPWADGSEEEKEKNKEEIEEKEHLLPEKKILESGENGDNSNDTDM